MFKNLMASIGIGSAKLRLQLLKSDLRQGEAVQGIVYVEGGKVTQKVDQLYFHLDISSHYEHNDKLHPFDSTLDTQISSQTFEIESNRFKTEIPFSYTVPLNIPITAGITKYEFVAGLDIKNAINPNDHVPVKILPCLEVEAILKALDRLGFRPTRDSGNYNGKVQWLEFRPTEFMRGKLDELEVAVKINLANVVLTMAIDKKGKGLTGILTETLDADEKHVSLTLPKDVLLSGSRPNVEAVEEALRDFLTRQCGSV
ncbi:MAG: sporulation protein [Eubacteriales bacterium]